MKRKDLAGGVRECLQQFAQHYGVVPPLPPEESLVLGEAAARHGQALSALGESAALAQLCRVGILTERTGYARNRTHAAEEVLTILNHPFGEEPVLPGPSR